MAYPTKYLRQFDFASYQNSNPTRPLPGDRVNVDLDAAKQSVGEIVDFLKTSIRSDGKLANKTVGRYQIADDVFLGFDAPSAWRPHTLYTTSSTVFQNNIFYKATVVHTSGDSFDPSKWEVIADFSEGVDAAVEAADAAATSAAAAAADRVQTGADVVAAGAAQTAAEAAQALAEAAAASIALVITPQQHGAVAGEDEDGVANATAFQEAIDTVADAGGGVVWVRNLGIPYVIGDGSTSNTCIRMKSNVTLLHEPGVVYLHKALGRTSPQSTHIQSAWLARQACMFQLDGCENGALENYAILGHPKIDGQGTTPIRRGVNMYGEHNNFTIEVWGANLRDMLLTWGDDDDFRFSKGDNGAFSLKYTGTNNAGGTLYELVNLFPKADRSGRPGVRHLRFYDCDIDGTNGTTASDTTHAVAGIKFNNCEDITFGPRVKIRGGSIGCLTFTNGVRKVRGEVDTGDSRIGVVVSDVLNNIALDNLTGDVKLNIQHSGNLGGDRLNAVVIQGACEGVDISLQSESGGVEFRESDTPTFGLSGLTTSTSTIAISVASPGVVTWTSHGLSVGTPMKFTTTGALPTGLIAGKTYFVKTVLDANTFTVTDTLGGTVIATTGSQSGTHTAETRLAKGVSFSASGGSSGLIQGLNPDGTMIGLARAGLGAIAASETFTAPGVSGTIATVYEPDATRAPRVVGYVKRGYVHMETVSTARNPIRNAFIDLAIDGVGHATISGSDTGSANWNMADSDIRLKFINPPTFPLSNYGRNNKIEVSSDGSGSLVAGSSVFREFGKGTILDVSAGPNNAKHQYLYTVETGGSQLRVGNAAAPSTITRKSVSLTNEIVLGSRVLRADFMLSDSAKTQVLLPVTYPCFVTGVQLVYPEGTTSDAGVAVRVGTLASAGAVLSVTSGVSQTAGDVVSYSQTGAGSTVLKETPVTNGVLTASCAGGKTGANPVTVLVHVVELMPVS